MAIFLLSLTIIRGNNAENSAMRNVLWRFLSTSSRSNLFIGDQAGLSGCSSTILGPLFRRNP